MFKVVIADDERIQREGIARHIRWAAHGMQVAGIAEDGRQALALIENENIDFLITDIRMPGMDGLMLAEKAQAVNPDIKILMISGYDDFEYARTAIELKAHAYLLKPINIGVLNEKVEQIGLLIGKEREAKQKLAALQKQLEESKPLLLEKLVLEAIYGAAANKELVAGRIEALGIAEPAGGYVLLLLQLDEADEAFSAMEQQLEQPLAYLRAYQSLDAYIKERQYGMTLQTKVDECMVILKLPDRSSAPFIEEVLDYIRSTLMLSYNDRLTICLSTVKTSYAQLHEGFEECLSAARRKFYLGKGNNIAYEDVIGDVSVAPDYGEQYERMIQAFEIGNAAVAAEQLEMIFVCFSSAGKAGKPMIKAFCFRLMSDLLRMAQQANEKLEAVFGDEHQIWNRIYHFDTLPEIKEWLREMVITACRHIHSKRTRKHAHIAETIIRMLEERYREQLTIDELARQVHLTPNYVSNIFKEHVGESVIDYLTKVRMKQAVRLLADESVRIYEVAERTGYNSTSYFSVVFKNMYGVSPKEYRDQQLQS